jgi:hypothetical protein
MLKSLRESNLHVRQRSLFKIAGAVYSEEQTWSTGFGRLQPLRFHAHAFPPQRTAPFLVQPVVGRFDGEVRKRALTGN